MKKKQIIFLVVQAILLIIAGVLLMKYVQGQIKPQTAYIFTSDLPPNTKITENHVEAVEIPTSAITEGFEINYKPVFDEQGNLLAEGIEDMYTASKVFKGQYIVKDMLIKKDEIDPFEIMDLTKLRKVSLPISYETGFGGNIKRGDQIDLVFIGQGEKENGDSDNNEFIYSKIFLQGAYVYNVITEDGFKYNDHSTESLSDEIEGEEISNTANSDALSVITLAVTAEQSEEINARLNAGKISLVGRFDNSKSYETLGYVLGDYTDVFVGNVNAETNILEINNDSKEENLDTIE